MYLFINLGKLIIISDKFLRFGNASYIISRKECYGKERRWEYVRDETFFLLYILLFKVAADNEDDTQAVGNQMM